MRLSSFAIVPSRRIFARGRGFALATLFAICFTSTASAQFQLGLLISGTAENPNFDAEFHLTKDQREAAEKATSKARAALREVTQKSKDLPAAERARSMLSNNKKIASEYEADLDKILRPEQMKRLREICLQSMGAMALSSPVMQDALKISPEQKMKWNDVVQTYMMKMRDAMQQPGGPERQERTDALRKEMMNAAMNVLNDDQRAAWRKMLGDPASKIKS